MKELSSYPYFEIQFTKEGAIYNAEEVNLLHTALRDNHITDLLIMSHGWNNDMDDARMLYRNLVAQISRQQRAFFSNGHRFGVVAVLWPSKKFAEKELIAGGAASLSAPGESDELHALLGQLENLEDFFDADHAREILQKAKATAREINRNPHAQNEFVSQMNNLLTTGIRSNAEQPVEDGVSSFAGANPKELLVKLEDHWEGSPNGDTGGAAEIGVPGNFGTGGAAGFAFGDIVSGARNLLNFVTYYQMKERAGKVGSRGLHTELMQLRRLFPQVKLHLIGHSFGGRLVTAAVAGPDERSALKVDTLILLQAAFSHYGFAEKYDLSKNGFFRRVVSQKKVLGPILVSYTRNDKAVGIAYAIASRIARQVGEGLGDKNDLYGGIGGNGARSTPEANNEYALNKTNTYSFKKGILYNLNGDACISNHSDICKEEVARAILAAVEA